MGESLTRQGFAELPQMLNAQECCELIGLYGQPDLFRSRVDMSQYRFGKGEYQYFRYPLPPLVERLRRELYPRLAPVANRWRSSSRTTIASPKTSTPCSSAAIAQARPVPPP